MSWFIARTRRGTNYPLSINDHAWRITGFGALALFAGILAGLRLRAINDVSWAGAVSDPIAALGTVLMFLAALVFVAHLWAISNKMAGANEQR